MQDAETILGLIRERGRTGLPLERVYRLLFNQHLYLRAYGKIYRNTGAMTHGITDETPDTGFALNADATPHSEKSTTIGLEPPGSLRETSQSVSISSIMSYSWQRSERRYTMGDLSTS
jgi:hypothetical protein